MNQPTTLTCLPAAGPENVFEPIVNRHHAQQRAKAARMAQERAKRALVKNIVLAAISACAAAGAVWWASYVLATLA